jgi:histidinol-phosphate phosphatase family protein
MLNQQGIPVIVVTNQSGIGRSYYREEDFREVQIEVERQLSAHGARIDRTYHCPHDPRLTRCRCRKPGQELFRRAATDFGLRLDRCLYVGDRARDVEPGIALGGEAILVAGADGKYDQPVSAEVARAASLKDAILAAVPRSES